MVEITEEELRNVLSSSLETIKEYVLAHPSLLYKGVPFVVVIWFTYPLLALTWSWLPWMWASYEIYKLLPTGTWEALRNYEPILEYMRKSG